MPAGENGIGRGVVVDDIDDAAHPARMDGVDQFAEVVHRAQFRIDVPVIPDGVRRPKATFSRLFPDRIDWKEPDDVNTQVADPVQIPFQCLNISMNFTLE